MADPELHFTHGGDVEESAKLAVDSLCSVAFIVMLNEVKQLADIR
jgi:hypothetical protein